MNGRQQLIELGFILFALAMIALSVYFGGIKT